MSDNGSVGAMSDHHPGSASDRVSKLVWMLHNCGDGFLSDRIVATLTERGRNGELDEATRNNVSSIIGMLPPEIVIRRLRFGECGWPNGGIYLDKENI